jgi:peptidylprolyl isomerase
MKFRLSVALAALITATAAAQTTTGTTQKRTTTRRTSPTAASKPAANTTAIPAAPAVNPADTPPNVPKVEGAPKPLYTLRYVDTQIGTGDLAKQQQYYTVRYTGWLTDGTKFDSSDDHPGAEPIVFPYGARRVIAGWDTGFEGMHVGGKRRLFVPYQLAYGESGRPPVIPPKAETIRPNLLKNPPIPRNRQPVNLLHLRRPPHLQVEIRRRPHPGNKTIPERPAILRTFRLAPGI